MLIIEAQDHSYHVIIGGDFNLSLDVGPRGDAMKELCDQFHLHIFNGVGNAHSNSNWTFRSSMGHLRRIDYILHTHGFHTDHVSASDLLDLGSDHRYAQSSLSFTRSSKNWTLQGSMSSKGWRPYLDIWRSEAIS